MADQDLRAEMELLREQLTALQREREETGAENKDEKTAEPTSTPQEAAPDLNDLLQDVGEDSLDLAGQVGRLLDSLDKDTKDTKPSTLLIVFALGVLIGRLR